MRTVTLILLTKFIGGIHQDVTDKSITIRSITNNKFCL